MSESSGSIDLGLGADTLILDSASLTSHLEAMGGEGHDTLVLNGPGPFDLSDVSLSGFETLRSQNSEDGRPSVILTGQQIENLTVVDDLAITLKAGDAADISGIDFQNGSTVTVLEIDVTYTGVQGLTLRVDGGAVVLTGSGNDDIVSGPGNNSLSTGGADSVNVLAGADDINTGLGDDTITYQPSLAYGSGIWVMVWTLLYSLVRSKLGSRGNCWWGVDDRLTIKNAGVFQRYNNISNKCSRRRRCLHLR